MESALEVLSRAATMVNTNSGKLINSTLSLSLPVAECSIPTEWWACCVISSLSQRKICLNSKHLDKDGIFFLKFEIVSNSFHFRLQYWHFSATKMKLPQENHTISDFDCDEIKSNISKTRCS